MDRVATKRATKESFSEFGSVVTMPTGATTSQGPAYKFWSDIVHYRINGETEIGICTVYATGVRTLSGAERHPGTPEILIPIDGPFVLPLVRELNGKFCVDAFTVEVGEAVVINAGVWHGPCFPLNQKSESYFVIFRRGTPAHDVERCEFPALEVI